jgi:hypothetical protein
MLAYLYTMETKKTLLTLLPTVPRRRRNSQDGFIKVQIERGGKFGSSRGNSKPSKVDEVDELLREWTTVLG